MNESSLPSIPEYFKGKNVFITGATGFIGKVLIEKLLRSCPEIGNIYVLIREKKGKDPAKRIKEMTDVALFDVLKKTYPDNLRKILPIIGDVTEISLGISQDDRNKLIDEIHIVYHIAASIRFDDPLKYAILMNTRGTREVLHLVKEIKHLEVFMHLSTTYCNIDKKVIDEKVYPPHDDWRRAIELAENADPRMMDILTPKFMEPFPNTYTFTKSMGEHVVKDLCDGKIPAIIFRPSIVICTMTDPFPGWMDNFNGPVGILVASGKGVMRSVYADPQIRADYVPCDSVVKGMIMATWKKALERDEEKYRVSVYNASSYRVQQVSVGELVHLGRKLCWEMPLNDIIWYPNGSVTKCWYENYLKLIFYQLLPALFIDGLLVSLGKKPMLIKIHRRIFIANSALAYFLNNQWDFLNNKTLELEKLIKPEDLKAFSYETGSKYAEPYEFFKNGLWGGRRYLLHEPDSTMDKAVAHSRRMWIIAQVFNSLWYAATFYIVWSIIKIFIIKMEAIIEYFNTP
nr:unnamed protein product [Callosobruchus analis]